MIIIRIPSARHAHELGIEDVEVVRAPEAIYDIIYYHRHYTLLYYTVIYNLLYIIECTKTPE